MWVGGKQGLISIGKNAVEKKTSPLRARIIHTSIKILQDAPTDYFVSVLFIHLSLYIFLILYQKRISSHGNFWKYLSVGWIVRCVCVSEWVFLYVFPCLWERPTTTNHQKCNVCFAGRIITWANDNCGVVFGHSNLFLSPLSIVVSHFDRDGVSEVNGKWMTVDATVTVLYYE